MTSPSLGHPEPSSPAAYAPPPVVVDPRRWGLGDVVYGLVLFFVGQVGASVFLVLAGFIDVDSGEVETLPVAAVLVTVAAGWFGLIGWPLYASYGKGQKSLRKDFGLAANLGDVGWGVLGGAAALGLSIVANLFWIVVSGDEPPSNSDFLPTDVNLIGALAMILAIAVGTPIAEELFFRGLFLRTVAKRWSVRIGVVVSTLVFGTLHLQSFDLHGVFIVAVTACYGAMFAWLTVWRDRLGPAIVAHMVVNGTGVVVTLIAG